MDDMDNLYEEEFDDVIRDEEHMFETSVRPSEETLEKVLELKASGRESKVNKFFMIMCKLGILISILGIIYMQSLYLPKAREMNTDNLFSDGEVIVSSEEVNDICSLLESEFGFDLDEENDNSLLINAIYCNEYLTDSEKEYCCKFLDLFNDNPYLDKERVYHSLLNLDISYKRRPFTYKDNVEGVYVDKYKSIGVFVDDEDKHVVSHELVHCICANDGSLPKFFSEGMTELLTNEYFAKNPFIELDNYPFEVYTVKMLCDVAGSSAMLEAYTTGDMRPVYESLASYYGTVEDAKTMINIFEDLFMVYRGEKDDLAYSNEDLTNKAYFYLNEVALAKYGEENEPMNFDRMCFFYHEIMTLNVCNGKPIDALRADLEEYGIYFKPYFSSKLKEQYSKPTIAKYDDAVIINDSESGKTLVK